MHTKGTQDQIKLARLENGVMRAAQLDKAKQERLTLEKELIKQREVADLKTREVSSLLQRVEAHKFDDMQTSLGKDLQDMAQKKKDALFGGMADEQANQKI